MKIDPWTDVRDHLSPATRALFELPEYAQASANPYSMANFATLVAPLIDCLRPKHFCEIGSEKGLNTRFLIACCRKYGARLSIVDPTVDGSDAIGAEPFVTYHKQKSIDFLQDPNDVDVYYIDGDHNYQTVSQELDLIRENRRRDQAVCVFVHDTSWPCGRRDFYYLPNSIKYPHPHAGAGFGISPYAQDLQEGEGYAVDWPVAIAVSEGGPRNGVLTAVEDFLSQAQDSGWRQTSIPSLFGLHILWHEPSLTEAQRRVFDVTADRLETMRPFLSILELNRTVLLTMAANAGEQWKRQRQRIAELERERTELRSLLGLLVKWPLRPFFARRAGDTD